MDDFDLRVDVTGNPTDPSEDGKSVVFNTDDMTKLRDALMDGIRMLCTTNVCTEGWLSRCGFRRGLPTKFGCN